MACRLLHILMLISCFGLPCSICGWCGDFRSPRLKFCAAEQMFLIQSALRGLSHCCWPYVYVLPAFCDCVTTWNEMSTCTKQESSPFYRMWTMKKPPPSLISIKTRCIIIRIIPKINYLKNTFDSIAFYPKENTGEPLIPNRWLVLLRS